jgi:hypothetical protein
MVEFRRLWVSASRRGARSSNDSYRLRRSRGRRSPRRSTNCATFSARPRRNPSTAAASPQPVEARPGPNEFLALLSRRRQRPCRCDLMRVGQVFETEAPMLGLLDPRRLEASRDQSVRHRGRNLCVERDFLPPAVPGAGQTLGKRGLEDERVRGASARAIVGQAQSNDLRQHGRPRAFHRDCADASVRQRAATAERAGEAVAVGDFRQRLRRTSGPRRLARDLSASAPALTCEPPYEARFRSPCE